jgi:hypothetical protein
MHLFESVTFRKKIKNKIKKEKKRKERKSFKR